jgi:RimJ/RimL family protein N-acetyltransferase
VAARTPDGRVLGAPGLALRPLVVTDAAALFAALDDARVWASGYGGGPTGRPDDVEAMVRFIAALTSRPGQQQYALEVTADGPGDPAGALVGTSGLGDVDLANERVHLGWTAYAPSVWSTRVNPAAKLALLRHAFEDCGMHRVKLQTDAINARSRAAIARLGAAQEGVLRQHIRRVDGTWRDTVVFSILVDEWPTVRRGLELRVAAGSADLGG